MKPQTVTIPVELAVTVRDVDEKDPHRAGPPCAVQGCPKKDTELVAVNGRPLDNAAGRGGLTFLSFGFEGGLAGDADATILVGLCDAHASTIGEAVADLRNEVLGRQGRQGTRL